jgi:hypothetical protein
MVILMQIALYALAAVGFGTVALFLAAFLKKRPDPSTRLKNQHLERWGQKP